MKAETLLISFGVLAVFLILLGIGFFDFLLTAPSTSAMAVSNLTPSICSDGTLYGQCSASKPYYCLLGNLVISCSNCGCPIGQSCDSTTKKCAIASVGQLSVNPLREKEQLSNLSIYTSPEGLTLLSSGNLQLPESPSGYIVEFKEDPVIVKKVAIEKEIKDLRAQATRLKASSQFSIANTYEQSATQK
jgi:hypothetical protein